MVFVVFSTCLGVEKGISTVGIFEARAIVEEGNPFRFKTK